MSFAFVHKAFYDYMLDLGVRLDTAIGELESRPADPLDIQPRLAG